MVAVLLRLRFRVLANTLQSNPLQLVSVILGGVTAVALVFAALVGMLIASLLPPAVTQAVVIVGGSALVFGWLIIPLLFDGVDRTLDPLKLARFPVRTGTLMAAMFLVGIAWVPGIATTLVSVGTAVAWRTQPLPVAAALLGGLVGAATCIAASRLTTTIAGRLLSGGGASRAGVAAVAALVLVVPFAIATLNGIGGGRESLSGFSVAVEVLGWSPLGAVWSVPGRLAMGDAAGAAAAAAIALLTLVAVLLLWRLALSASLRVRGERAPRTIAGGRLGPIAWMPATPAGATIARSLIYWFRDARQARQLLLLPTLPALMLLWWSLFQIDAIALAIGPVVAALLPLSAFAGLSYDGTAFAAVIAAGVRGRDDRLGRAVALLIIALPATVIVQVAVAVVLGRAGDLPALLGLSLSILLISIGVVSVSSARLVVPVARAGRNPFSAQPGSATTSILASYLVALVTFALALPVLVLAVIALAVPLPALGWLALAIGLGLGGAVAVGGVVLGGRLLDASAPAMLARLHLVRA